MLTVTDREAAERLLPVAGRVPALDALGRLAARLLGTRSAQVSLLTEVQTIAGGTELPPGTIGGRTPLADSLCTVTASSRAPLVVCDTRAEPRVRDLPSVASGMVGSYLGVPLIVGETSVVGALCVFGPEVHEWTAADVTLLEQLGEWAVAELELAALGVEHQDSRTRWELAVDAAGVGSFDYDLVTQRLDWDDRMLELFGYDRATFVPHIDSFHARVHPDDLARVTRAIDVAVAAAGVYRAEYRILLPSGVTRWARARGRVQTQDGRPVRLMGATLETTEAREGELRVSRALEAMSAGVILLDRDWTLTHVNAAAEALLGMSREDMLGRDHWALFPAGAGAAWEQVYRDAVASGEPATVEAHYGPPVDAWLDVRVSPSPDGVILSFSDVTGRREADELVRLSTHLAERLTGSLDIGEAVAELASLVVPRLADWSIVSLVGEDGRIRDVGSAHVDETQCHWVEQYTAHRHHLDTGTTAVQEVLRSKTPLVLEADALATAVTVLRSPKAIEAITALAPESAAVLPLDANGRLQGILSLCRGRERSPMTKEELAVAVSVAGRAALALDNARLYTEEHAAAERLQVANRRLREVAEHERTVAQALQAAMLTRLPEPDHLHLVARYLTASTDEQVGGDWYDALVLPSGATTIVIGDVVGHDILAAALMGQLRNMLRTLAWDRDEPPSEIVARLDRAMRDLRLETFATLIMLRIEQDEQDRRDGTRTVRWTSAGHPAPLLLLADGTTELLSRPNDVLLGIAPESLRHDHVHRMLPESTLLLYTDGLVETRTQDVVEGQRRLAATVAEHRDLVPDDLLDAILADMVGPDPDDDVALLAVRMHDEARPRPPEAGPEHL